MKHIDLKPIAITLNKTIPNKDNYVFPPNLFKINIERKYSKSKLIRLSDLK